MANAQPRKFGAGNKAAVPQVVERQVEMPAPQVVEQVEQKNKPIIQAKLEKKITVDELEYNETVGLGENPEDEDEDEDPIPEDAEDSEPLEAPRQKVKAPGRVLTYAERGVGLLEQRVEMPIQNRNLMFPNNEVVSQEPGVLGKRKNILVVKQVKRTTKAGAAGQCKCGVNITLSNKSLPCSKVSGNNECDVSFCITCLIGKQFCDKCKCPLTFMPNNNKIKSAEVNLLLTTHSFSGYILESLPFSFFEAASDYIEKEKTISEFVIKVLENKLKNDFMSKHLNKMIIDLQKSKADFKKPFETIITKIKADKMNIKCLRCKGGSLTKARDEIKCNNAKCYITYCNGCYNVQGHDGPCNNRAMICGRCDVLTEGSCNIFCLGCFTFYSNNMDLTGLFEHEIDEDQLPVIGNSDGLFGSKKDFVDNYESNKATLISYIQKYNHTISSKNIKLFWLFVENVLCGSEVTLDHDKRIVDYAMIQADRNMLNKIEQLEKFLINGIAMEEIVLINKVKTINKLFTTTIDKKPLIGDKMQIKPLTLKTKVVVVGDA